MTDGLKSKLKPNATGYVDAKIASGNEILPVKRVLKDTLEIENLRHAQAANQQ